MYAFTDFRTAINVEAILIVYILVSLHEYRNAYKGNKPASVRTMTLLSATALHQCTFKCDIMMSNFSTTKNFIYCNYDVVTTIEENKIKLFCILKLNFISKTTELIDVCSLLNKFSEF